MTHDAKASENLDLIILKTNHQVMNKMVPFEKKCIQWK